MDSVNIRVVFAVLLVDWHYGADAYLYTDREEAFRQARAAAYRRAERPEMVVETVPPSEGVLLHLTYLEDGEGVVWVEEKTFDIPVQEPDCNCV